MRDRKDYTKMVQQYADQFTLYAGIDDPLLPFKDLRELANQLLITFIPLNSGHMSLQENLPDVLDKMPFID